MASAFEEQGANPAAQSLLFDESFGMLVDCALTLHDNRRLARRLCEARLKSSQACVADIRCGEERKLDKFLMARPTAKACL